MFSTNVRTNNRSATTLKTNILRVMSQLSPLNSGMFSRGIPIANGRNLAVSLHPTFLAFLIMKEQVLPIRRNHPLINPPIILSASSLRTPILITLQAMIFQPS